MLKLRKGLVILLVSLLLSGCSNLNFTNIQDAIVPPNMTGEQNAIYEVILKTAGKDIKLKYPRAGELRNAILMQDFDRDGINEAVVFYQSTAVNANPHVFIKILKGGGKDWSVVADIEGDGSDIDRVVFGRSTENNEWFMAVGYEIASMSDKLFRVYAYNGGDVTSGSTVNYSMLETYDLDMDANDELLYIHKTVQNTVGSLQTPAVYAGMMRRIGGQFITVSKTPMDVEVYDYIKIAKGRLHDGRPALYLDGQKDGELLTTEILCENEGKLQNLMYSEKDRTLLEQTRRERVQIADVNNDQIIDIPQAYTMGSELQSDTQQTLTDWYDYKNGKLVKMMSSYVNGTDSYIFSFPKDWEYKVGVERDAERREVTFYAYESGDTKSRAILKLRTQRRTAEIDDAEDGYVYITSNGQLSYYAFIPQSISTAYQLTAKQIKNNLILS